MTAMKTTILQHSNIWWEQTQADILAWWHQTGQKHWQKWGVWVWLLICFMVFAKLFLVEEGNELKKSLQEVQLNLHLKKSKAYIYGALTGRIFGWIAAWITFAIYGLSAGFCHYFLIYRPIFRSYKAINIALYFLVCSIVYMFFLRDYFFIEIIDLHEDKFNRSITYVLWVASLMFSIIYDFKKNEKNKQMLERERNIAEIQALKAQINPHFLFNTLNNLYGTAVLEESPKTADGIQQLARIMRHAVESSKNDRIEIDKEISFLHDYIEIQQLRIPKRDNIRIQTAIQWDEQPAEIAPLILMTFAENAFKFGISIAYECFLEIKLTVENQQLTFICRNSVLPRTSLEQGTGTGLDNTLKRLKLLYPKKHTISINQTDSVYEVFLTINLHD